jgi:ribosomal protein L11 methylase PrmA
MLDFGCGSGILIKILREQGVEAVRYDTYGKEDR